MANTSIMIVAIFFSVVAATEISTLSAFATTTSNKTDFQSLLDFKNCIQKDPYQVLNSWNNSIHFCNWHGITCGIRLKRVTILNVSAFHLVGTLSPSIGNLTFLRNIYLNDNSFHGGIPTEIGSLIRLQSLVLRNNTFEGHIPANLASCKNLQFLHLYNNNFSGKIPEQLGNLSNLIDLELSRNSFTGSIPPSLGNISSLQTLDLSLNKVIGNIPHELGNLVNLQNLRLSDNSLFGSIPLSIYNLSSIQFLGIPMNFLTGQFPDSLGLTLPKMTKLLAYSNNLSGSIPSTLANASDLKIIDIGDNFFTGTVPRNIARLHQLQELHIYNNPLGISKDNDISIISSLTNCTHLSKLILSGIGMGGVLPLEISNLSRTLTIFMLSYNHISGNLPVGVGDLVSLSNLDMSNNYLSGIIPHSIGKLKNLKKLFLVANNFSGEIPESICDISGLLFLDLSQNMLTGSLPSSLRNLTSLEVLDLSLNSLNGSISKEIFSLTSLSLGLFLGHNNFTGSLPSDMGNLKNIIELTVHENKLSGEIPQSIGECVMLTNLQMQGNFLHGSIPSTLKHLLSMNTMDLSRNKLSGEIPASLSELKFINFLNLSFNLLEGEVPRNGVFENVHSFSILGNGMFCGGTELLNLSECPSKDSKNHRKLSTYILIILVICILIALLLLFRFALYIYQRKKSILVRSSTCPYDKKLLKISYADIIKSTNGFSTKNLIGEGKYGSVYHGVLKPSGKVVAIKVLKLQIKGAHKSFLTECEALRNIRHINIAKIITSCSNIDFKALIYEYAPNGSLEEWLHQNPYVHVDEKKLDLLERLNIAVDIATALSYLHNYTENPIVHCDIKPSNILLGHDLRGLVSDFGLAKFLPKANDTSHDKESTSIEIRGTIGYVAPEYGMGGDITVKGDIYSYGILLLEMFTGKRPTDIMFTEDFNLHNYVKAAIHHQVAEIIDPQILMVEDEEENRSNDNVTKNIESCCLSIFRVGVSCSYEMQNMRMDINDALSELQEIRNKM